MQSEPLPLPSPRRSPPSVPRGFNYRGQGGQISSRAREFDSQKWHAEKRRGKVSMTSRDQRARSLAHSPSPISH